MFIEYAQLFGKKTGMAIEKENKFTWTYSEDYFLLEGINKYGLQEWTKIITDLKLWNSILSQGTQPEQIWKVLFMKIEECEPSPNQESEGYE